MSRCGHALLLKLPASVAAQKGSCHPQRHSEQMRWTEEHTLLVLGSSSATVQCPVGQPKQDTQTGMSNVSAMPQNICECGTAAEEQFDTIHDKGGAYCRLCVKNNQV